MKNKTKLFGGLLLLLMTVMISSALLLDLPRSDTVFISDNAHIFTPEDIESISSYHQMMLDKYDVDYRIVTSNEYTDIDAYAHNYFQDEKIGEYSKTARGLLLVINTANRLARLEVSANLESIFTDAFVGYVEERQMVPFFRLDRVGDGVFATSEILRVRANDAMLGNDFDLTEFKGSMGGGAKTDTRINEGKDTSFAEGKSDIPAADTPEETLQGLFLSLKTRNARPDLDIFTSETREYMAGLVVTPAQMDNTARRYQNCKIDRIIYSEDGKRAVLLHDLADRACDPFVFDKGEDGKWRLNLKAIGTGFGHTFGNVWYVDYGNQKDSGLYNYYFGFQDYSFSRHTKELRFNHQGFPKYYPWGLYARYCLPGALITRMDDEGYIKEIGLREGDVILGWDSDYLLVNGELHSTLPYIRDDLDIYVRFARGNEIKEIIAKAPSSKRKPRWGVTTSPLACFSDVNGESLPMVLSVTPGMQADRLGLKPGDFINKWNGKHLSVQDIY